MCIRDRDRGAGIATGPNSRTGDPRFAEDRTPTRMARLEQLGLVAPAPAVPPFSVKALPQAVSFRTSRDGRVAWVPEPLELLDDRSETGREIADSFGAVLGEIADAHPGETVLVVSHGTALNCLISTLLEMPETHVFRIDIANCGLTEVEVREGRPYVVRLNDTAHLAGI